MSMVFDRRKDTDREPYDVDLNSGRLTPPGGGNSFSKSYQLGDDEEDTPTIVKDISRVRRVRRLPYVEPAFALFQLGLFFITPLKNEFVYSHLLNDAIEVGKERMALVNSTAQNLTFLLEHGRPVDEEVLPLGFINSSSHAVSKVHNFDHSEFWDSIKQRSSLIVLFLDLLKGIPGIFMNPVICAYTDVVGRRVGMILPCVGLLIELSVYLAVLYTGSSITYLAIGHVFEGLLGSSPALFGVAYAYVADTSPPALRTFRFVILNALFLLSYTVGTLSVGLVIDTLGYEAALWMTIVFLLLSIAYSFFILEETIDNSSAVFSIRQIFVSTKTAFSIYAMKRENREQVVLGLLLVCMFLQGSMLVGIGDLYVMYLFGPPFLFSSIKIGAFLSEYAMANVVGPILAIGLFRKHFRDVTLTMFACILSAFGFVLFAFMPPGNFIYIVPLGLCMAATFAPLLRAMMSKIVTENEQGFLQATLSFTDSLGEVVASPIHLAIFSATLDFFPGCVFLVLAALMLIMLSLLGTVKRLSGDMTDTKEELSD